MGNYKKTYMLQEYDRFHAELFWLIYEIVHFFLIAKKSELFFICDKFINELKIVILGVGV